LVYLYLYGFNYQHLPLAKISTTMYAISVNTITYFRTIWDTVNNSETGSIIQDDLK